MKRVNYKYFADRIIEKVPELKLVDKKVAEKIILQCIKMFVYQTKEKIENSPLCYVKVGHTNIFLDNFNVGYVVNRQRKEQKYKTVWESIHDSEVDLPTKECPIKQEWKTNRIRRADRIAHLKKAYVDKQQKREGVQK